jgi:predicted amidohydrolase YtcJ
MSDSPAPDHILTDGRIHTLDPEAGVVQALAIRDGRVLAAGTNESIMRLAGNGTEVTALHGRCVLPGLTDSHLHLQHLAFSLARIDCETNTLEACLSRVQARAEITPRGTWVLGHGWNQNSWGEFPDRQSLDSVAPGRPIYLTAKSLHAGWVSSAALSIAGLDRNTADPPDGRLLRTPDGELTGVLLEGAMRLVSAAIPAPSLESIVHAIEAVQETLWSLGLTAVHDFDGPECFAALQILRERGSLGLRVLKSIPHERLDEALALGLRSGFGDDWLRLGAVKVFADGALGPRTAAMLAPYDGEPDNRGTLLQDRESLFEIGRQALPAGIALAIHAIGDKANHEVLEAFAELQRRLPGTGLPAMPSRIEHVQLLHPDDVPRLAALGLVASMQPIHATSDMPMAERYWGSRTRTSYAWRSLERAGTRLVFGSDAPVESPNPFWGLHAAVTRRRQDGSPGPEGWIPEERLARQQALNGLTREPAALAGLAGQQGTLRPAAYADLIVLDEDPLTCPVESIPALRPRATMVGGRWRRRDI